MIYTRHYLRLNMCYMCLLDSCLMLLKGSSLSLFGWALCVCLDEVMSFWEAVHPRPPKRFNNNKKLSLTLKRAAVCPLCLVVIQFWVCSVVCLHSCMFSDGLCVVSGWWFGTCSEWRPHFYSNTAGVSRGPASHASPSFTWISTDHKTRHSSFV